MAGRGRAIATGASSKDEMAEMVSLMVMVVLEVWSGEVSR
jgi:hypothetical protein